MDSILLDGRCRPTPAPAERGLKRWRRAAETSTDPELAAFMPGRPAGARARLLGGIFAGSPFLTDCLLAEPGVLRLLAEQGPDAAHAALLARAGRGAGRRPHPADGGLRRAAAPARAADRARAT